MRDRGAPSVRGIRMEMRRESVPVLRCPPPAHLAGTSKGRAGDPEKNPGLSGSPQRRVPPFPTIGLARPVPIRPSRFGRSRGLGRVFRVAGSRVETEMLSRWAIVGHINETRRRGLCVDGAPYSDAEWTDAPLLWGPILGLNYEPRVQMGLISRINAPPYRYFHLH